MLTLFDDTEIFHTGTGAAGFDLSDEDVMLIDNFFTKEESDYYYNILPTQPVGVNMKCQCTKAPDIRGFSF